MIEQFLMMLKKNGVQLGLQGDQLRIRAPEGTLTPAMRESIHQYKPKLMALLRESRLNDDATGRPPLVLRPDLTHEPFTLTQAQHAYWLGRNSQVELGGVATHFYIELERSGWDFDLLEKSLQRLIARHGMLRAVILEDGQQKIFKTVPHYAIVQHDLQNEDPASIENNALLFELRKNLSHKKTNIETWPLFEIHGVFLPKNKLRLLLSIDMLIMDASSLFLFFRDWQRFYENPDWQPAPLQISARDYVAFERSMTDWPAFKRARDYWIQRLDTLPLGPELPLAQHPEAILHFEFSRRKGVLSQSRWKNLQNRAKSQGVTPSVLLMTAFSDVLRMWSREPEFTLNVTLFNRFPVHEEINQLLGDFTATNLLSVYFDINDTFNDRLHRLQDQFYKDLDHIEYNGMRVLRDRARSLGKKPGALMPIVFTSMLGLNATEENLKNSSQGLSFFGDYVAGISQTPQVWLDHQMIEWQGELMLLWDSVDALFPERMLDDMFSTYCTYLEHLADNINTWHKLDALHVDIGLPTWQKTERDAANHLIQINQNDRNDIKEAYSFRPLHLRISDQSQKNGDAPAVIAENRTLSYKELDREAKHLAFHLHQAGVRRGDKVAVVIEKGWAQIVAVLGVLHAGAAYMPIDPEWPQSRREIILEKGQVKTIIDHIPLEILEKSSDVNTPEAFFYSDIGIKPEDLAYVIFTSGSTGSPKGVMIEHRNADNTLQAMNAHLGVTSKDRLLGLSALHFDLSVYDIFGVLSTGGALVLPQSHQINDPEQWTYLLEKHHVTLWNSVPQLFQLWINHLKTKCTVYEKLKWAILSGDWIPSDLPIQAQKINSKLKIMASGGPTETAVWCAKYEIKKESQDANFFYKKKILYGKPLPRQTMHICQQEFRDCPVWVAGEILIGGVAPGPGYLQDPVQTAQKFVIHPVTGERLYRSGDWGRYLPGGDIEFLGRADFQVKINGLRIELGDIEAALLSQPLVEKAVAYAIPDPSTGHQQLVAYVTLKKNQMDACIESWPQTLTNALSKQLPLFMMPRHYVEMSELPLTPNGKINYLALPLPWVKNNEKQKITTPKNEAEQKINTIWCDILKRKNFGVDDNFFAMGADSLNMLRMLSTVADTFDITHIPQKILLQHFFMKPTIAEFAAVIQSLQESVGLENINKKCEIDVISNIEMDYVHLHDPFPMTGLQSGYLAGKAQDMQYHVSPNYYIEFDYEGYHDPARFRAALNAALQRQKNNISVLQKDGQLKIIEKLMPIDLAIKDIRHLSSQNTHLALKEIRYSNSDIIMPMDVWPWAQFGLTLYVDDVHVEKTRLHINVNNFFMDAFGAVRILNDIFDHFHHPEKTLPALDISIRDCVLAYQKIEASAQGKASENYWRQRLPNLPTAPQIPLKPGSHSKNASRLKRREFVLPKAIWLKFQNQASRHNVTLTTAVYGVYAQVLMAWSGSRHFLLSNMVTQRLPIHPQVMDVLGNMASVYPLEVDWRDVAPFHQQLIKLQTQLMLDSQHVHWSSAKVWQAINQLRNTPGQASAPFVVISALDMPAWDRPYFGCLQTPQVLIDHQFWNLKEDNFWTIWDVNEEFFIPGMIDAMWQSYRSLLTLLAQDDSAWEQTSFDLLPSAQRQKREEVNALVDARKNLLAPPVPDQLLHEALFYAMSQYPQKKALLTPSKILTYAALTQNVDSLKEALLNAGLQTNELVLVCIEKGWQQAVALYGVLSAGGAYVPIDPQWPCERRNDILQTINAKFILTDDLIPQKINVDSQNLTTHVFAENVQHINAQKNLAYVIYTSGSTGSPKGVMIDHRGAVNTITEINRRFNIGKNDVFFGLSSLTFDLSVYDVFGAFAAGASLVLPDAQDTENPLAWLQSMQRHRVTVWNSVPALMQLLVDAAKNSNLTLTSLKNVFLSGDWIDPNLPEKIKEMAPFATIVALGGATEASIWSIHHVIDLEDTSKNIEKNHQKIPYGKPLSNQQWHVLDAFGRDVPDNVPGELYIGGEGLALGYWGDEEKSAAAFVCHPYTGERLYKTGDSGCYLPDGNIELLGRLDLQIKLHGVRIELTEIEHVLKQHPQVRNAIAAVVGDAPRQRLVAGMVLRSEKINGVCKDVCIDVLKFAGQKLSISMLPTECIVLPYVPLTSNGKVDRAAFIDVAQARHGLPKNFVPPCTSIEKDLARIWEYVLNLAPNSIGLHDDFFEHGGQSLLAIQLVTCIQQKWGQKIFLADVFSERTIEKLAHKILVEEKINNHQ